MGEKNIAKLNIEILQSDEEDDPEFIDGLQRQLFQELSDLDVEEVQLKSEGETPEGSKGAEALPVEILVAFSVHFAPKVFEQLKNWVKRSPHRQVKLVSSFSGKEVAITISSEDLKTEEVNLIIKSMVDNLT